MPTSRRVLKKKLTTWQGLELPYEDAVLYEVLNTVAVDLSIFEHCNEKWLTAEELARRCDVQPSELFLRILRFLGWLHLLDVRGRRYKTSDCARPLSSSHFRDHFALRREERRWLSNLTDFLRTGQSIDFHASADPRKLALYHNAMSERGSLAEFLLKKLKLTAAPTALLDLGGGSGHMSEPFLARFPSLKVTILDLPSAVEQFRKGRIATAYGKRVFYIAADVRTQPLGTECYDVVIISFLIHHLQPEHNTVVLQRAIDSLRPGGVLAVHENLCSRHERDMRQEFFSWFLFALSSGARTFYLEDFHKVLRERNMSKPKFEGSVWYVSTKLGRS